MNAISNRLLHLYHQALPVEKAQGGEWYFRTHAICHALAREAGVSTDTACGVFAALSPSNRLLSNIRDTRKVLAAARDDRAADSFKVSTFHNNKVKALMIARTGDPLAYLRGPKVTAFFHNISNPSSPEFVTVDGHMVNAVNNVNRGVRQADELLTGDYGRIADAVKHAAYLSDVLPNQLQAVVWLVWKRLTARAVTHIQSEFFPSDYVAAGIINLAKQTV